jgi:hypothetical protein
MTSRRTDKEPAVVRLGGPSPLNIAWMLGVNVGLSGAMMALWTITYEWDDVPLVAMLAVVLALIMLSLSMYTWHEVVIEAPRATATGRRAPHLGRLAWRNWWEIGLRVRPHVREFGPGAPITKTASGRWWFGGRKMALEPVRTRASTLTRALGDAGLQVDDRRAAWARHHPRRWRAYRLTWVFLSVSLASMAAYKLSGPNVFGRDDRFMLLAILMISLFLVCGFAGPLRRGSSELPPNRPSRLSTSP